MRTVTFLCMLAVPTAAFGYTDPGTGIFLYQALAATVAGALWAARRFLTRLLGRGTEKTPVAGE